MTNCARAESGKWDYERECHITSLAHISDIVKFIDQAQIKDPFKNVLTKNLNSECSFLKFYLNSQ